MTNNHATDFIDNLPSRDTHQLTASNQLALAFLRRLLAQINKTTRESASLFVRVQGSSMLYGVEEALINHDLDQHARLNNVLNAVFNAPSDVFYEGLARKRELIQTAHKIVSQIKEGEKEGETAKEEQLASLLLHEKDLFLFFHPSRFGDHTTKKTIRKYQDVLRDSLLYQARVEKAVKSLDNVRIEINELTVLLNANGRGTVPGARHW